MTEKTVIHELQERIKTFCFERDWDQYHAPKELAIGLVTESAELLDHFRFKSEAQITEMLADAKKREHVEDELADAFYWILRMAQKIDVDLASAFERKMLKNEAKYPIEKVKGLNKKYTEY